MSTFTMRAVGAIGALALAAPAAAAAQQPTLQFDRGCYTDGQDMAFTGAGYTPGGQVDLLFASDLELRGATPATPTPPERSTGPSSSTTRSSCSRRTRAARRSSSRPTTRRASRPISSRRSRSSDSRSSPSPAGKGFFPGRYVPGKRASVEIYGWAFATGKVAWFLFQKGSRTVASVKVGRLDDECGDRTARIRVPRGLKPGAYRVVLTTDRKLRDRYTWRKARVTARRPASAAAARGMHAGAMLTGAFGGLR